MKWYFLDLILVIRPERGNCMFKRDEDLYAQKQVKKKKIPIDHGSLIAAQAWEICKENMQQICCLSSEHLFLITPTEGCFYLLDAGSKLNVHKMFRRLPRCHLNILCTFKLRPLSRHKLNFNFPWVFARKSVIEKQSSRGAPRKRCSEENMQQISRRKWVHIYRRKWIALRHGFSCSLLHIFREPFPKSTSRWLPLVMVTLRWKFIWKSKIFAQLLVLKYSLKVPNIFRK